MGEAAPHPAWAGWGAWVLRTFRTYVAVATWLRGYERVAVGRASPERGPRHRIPLT